MPQYTDGQTATASVARCFIGGFVGEMAMLQASPVKFAAANHI